MIVASDFFLIKLEKLDCIFLFTDIGNPSKWAKELDYPYLFFGCLGVIMSMNRLQAIETHLIGFEIFGPLIVTTAIVIRLVKTRVEIAGWNKRGI
jgi:hypothetical protein